MTDTINQTRPYILADVRKDFGATQTEFAAMMGLPFRTYQDIEAGNVAFRGAHNRALEMAMLLMADANDCPEKLPAELADLVKSLAAKMVKTSQG